METPIHTAVSLFDQLGLDSRSESIDAFIQEHQLGADIALEEASFWKSWQVAFFREVRVQDADWVEVVDELDAALHKDSMER